MNKNILLYSEFSINENQSGFNYDQEFSNLYEKFQQLEKQFNSLSLDQLKYEHKLNSILEQATSLNEQYTELNNKFYSFYNELPEDNMDQYSFLENKVSHLYNIIDDFISDLETLKAAFDMMGDIDRGTNYFRKIIF